MGVLSLPVVSNFVPMATGFQMFLGRASLVKENLAEYKTGINNLDACMPPDFTPILFCIMWYLFAENGLNNLFHYTLWFIKYVEGFNV